MCLENIIIDIQYKWAAHVERIFRNFQCALGHNRSRRIKNSAFVNCRGRIVTSQEIA